MAVSACGGGVEQAGEPGGRPAITGTAPLAVRGIPSVVTLAPDVPANAAPGPVTSADTVVMDQFAMAFFPGFLVIQPGQTIEFRNSETDAAHNVRVQYLPTDSMVFNVGSAQGIPYYHTFDQPGGYYVTCDIHPAMDAAFLVTGAPFVTAADSVGAFTFAEVPPGVYVARVWSIEPELRSERTVTLGSGFQHLDLAGGPTG